MNSLKYKINRIKSKFKKYIKTQKYKFICKKHQVLRDARYSLARVLLKKEISSLMRVSLDVLQYSIDAENLEKRIVVLRADARALENLGLITREELKKYENLDYSEIRRYVELKDLVRKMDYRRDYL